MPTKGKITSYIASHRASSASVKNENATTYEWFDPKLRDEVYNPDPERMIGTVLTRLMSYPGQALPREYNALLLHVIESYRIVKHDLDAVQSRINKERESNDIITSEFSRVGKSWASERERLQSEVKRLGSLVADGQKLTAGMPSAHQSNNEAPAIPMEAVKQRRSEEIKGIPGRCVPKEVLQGHSSISGRRVSPSFDMATLSRTLATDSDSGELPLGTPPSRGDRAVLAGVQDSPLRGAKSIPSSHRTTPAKSSTMNWSDEDMSSSGGDRLPDEFISMNDEFPSAASEMDVILRVTKWLAAKRKADPTDVFTKVAELVFGNELGKTFPSTPKSIRSCSDKPLPKLPISEDDSAVESIKRPLIPTRRVTDGELLTKLPSTSRLGPEEELLPADIRRFSFIPGDDTAPYALSRYSAGDQLAQHRANQLDPQTASITGVSNGSPRGHRNLPSYIAMEDRRTSGGTAMSIYRKSNSPSPTQNPSIGNLKRDDSGSNQSVVTAIRNNSGRSIVTPKPNSPNSMDGSDNTADPIKRLKPESAAIAAARAAAEGRSSPPDGTQNGQRRTKDSPRPVVRAV